MKLGFKAESSLISINFSFTAQYDHKESGTLTQLYLLFLFKMRKYSDKLVALQTYDQLLQLKLKLLLKTH